MKTTKPQPAVNDAEKRRESLRRWLGRVAVFALLAAAYVGVVWVPWPVAGWYTAPMGEIGPTFLFWNGRVYQYIDQGMPRFIGWYEERDGRTVLTNSLGAEIPLRSRGWGMSFKLPGDETTYYAYREWRFQHWWELRVKPLPEPSFPRPAM